MKSRPLPRLRPSAIRSSSILVAALASLSLLAGCGGGGGGSDPIGGTPVPPAATGKLSVGVVWPPAESRLVPSNALSVRIDVVQNGATVRSMTLAKPATNADFAELPLGALSVRATAFPTANATGTALATATVAATIAADTTVSVPITMASTVARLTVPSGVIETVAGATNTMTVGGRDANDGVVLLAPASLSYVSDTPSLVAVTKNADGTGKLTYGSGVGLAKITATESGSGKTVNLMVSVHAKVTVTPLNPPVSVSGQVQFSATVFGPSNTGVLWSVRESNGGTISPAGLYTAPGAKGTYHVIATALGDPNVPVTATVTVRSGTGSVIVN